MAKHVITKDQTATVWVEKDNTELTLAKGVTITADQALLNYDHDHVTFVVEGKIVTTDTAIGSIGAQAGQSADDTTIIIAASGRVTGEGDAIWIDGLDGSVQNMGRVVAKAGAGVLITDGDGFSIRNDNLIRSEAHDVVISAETKTTGRIVNNKNGLLDGFIDLHTSTGDIKVTNKGEITGNLQDPVRGITFGSGDDTLINLGNLNGRIELGMGDDLADLRKGKLTESVVVGGAGDDTFVIDRSDISIQEFMGGGDDTIRTTVSFALPETSTADIENLRALGKKAIDLTGNGLDNDLFGNGGDNVLMGGDGDDFLRGGAGADALWGNDGADEFEFFKAGTGMDTILDFNSNEDDQITPAFIPGVTDFADVHLRMTMAANGADTLIELGTGSVIRVVGVDKNDLHASDFFIFNGFDSP